MVLLIGTGYMAKEYAKVLSGMGISYEVVGRSEKNCELFREAFPGVSISTGGLENFSIGKNIEKAIVASSIDSLKSNVEYLLKNGVRKILLEKPGGISANELIDLNNQVKSAGAEVLIAYNRRFYSSVRKLREMAQEDGGILSFNFEFTECAHTIKPIYINPEIKANWFLANSSHVVDTAFFLGGKPKDWKPYHSGGLDWHPRSSIFAGAGISDTGNLFSYQANWESAGRWGVEVLTRKKKYILRPMEALHFQNIDELGIQKMELNDVNDVNYKPGLYLQTLSFLEGNLTDFCTLDEQVRIVRNFYSPMSGYLL